MLHELFTVLTAYWNQFLFALPRLVVAAVVLTVVWLAAERLRRFLAGKLAAHSADPLLGNFLTQVGRWLLVLAGALLALQIVGFSGVVGGLLGGLGLSAFLVGFAFKDIAENFLAGVILAFNRPFNINDSIQIKDMTGSVAELNLRTTRIKTYDGKDIYLPNSMVLKEAVTNFTRDGQIRQDFLVILDPKADIPAVIDQLMAQVHQEPEVLNDENHQAYAVIEDLTASAANVRVYFWASSDDYRRGVLQLRSRLINRAKDVVQAEKQRLANTAA